MRIGAEIFGYKLTKYKQMAYNYIYLCKAGTYMKRANVPRRLRIQAVAVFIIAFLIFNSVVHLQILHHKTEEELKAS